jgi:hypothetical protein
MRSVFQERKVFQRRQRGCIIPVILLTLGVIIGCGALTLLVIPRPPDALAELKSLTLYPTARAVTFTDNIRHEMIGRKSWSYAGGGGAVGSDYRRNLSVTAASMTFETSDEPNQVRAFYDNEVSNRGYFEVSAETANYQYLVHDRPLEIVAGMLAVIRGMDELDQPVNFRTVNITIEKMPLQEDGNKSVTQVSIEQTILSETGGLRD